MRITVLGPVAVECDGVPVNVGGSQQRRLLALLALNRGSAVSADRVADVLWSDEERPDGAARSVRTYVSRLRTALVGAEITTRAGRYTLVLGDGSVDVDEFEALIDQARAAVPDRALQCYDDALRLWRGEPCGEFTDEWWALTDAQRLRERRIEAELGRAEARMAMGHHNRAIADLERLAAQIPLDERPATLLMQALSATGRQAESMRVGKAFRDRLAEETGLEPSARLARLETAVAGGRDVPVPSVGRPLRGYVLHEAIGEGAHGRVYAATQPGTDRVVAVKVIRPDLADSTAYVVRFEAEARLIARLEHPHIVPLYDAWREPGGAFLVFRLLTGGTLRESIVSGGPWSVPRASQLVEQVGGALVAAHAMGVTHRDITSTNVLLDDDGVAYLSDFGIAVTNGDDDRRWHDEAADVRDLGRLLVEAVTGERGDAVDVGTAIRQLREAPDGLEAVLRRATDGTYTSAAELVLGWRAAVAGSDHRTPVRSDERRIVDAARQAAARQLALSASAGVNPYRGLRPFDEAHADVFHGRDAATAELASRVDTSSFVAVVGSSGSGKSSVVLAGLVPALRARGTAVVTLVPGDDPTAALTTALTEIATASAGDRSSVGEQLAAVARAHGRVVVVVDQFEECWTRATDERRAGFLDTLATAVADDTIDVRVVVAVRADLLERPLDDPAIGALVGSHAYLLPALSVAELHAAVVEPAAGVGVTFDDDVVARLVADAVGAPGALPLLQFAVTELYDRRVDARIGGRALDEIGGMAGVLGRRAEGVHAALDGAGRRDAHELFLRLVSPTPDGPAARRRVRVSELSAGMRSAADAFVAARLLTADRDAATREPTFEIAHDALLTRWPRLAAWLDEDRRWIAQLAHLSSTARAWDEGGRSDADLYRGVRLEAAIEALDDGRVVTDLEREFVDAGRAERDAARTRAVRSARRLRRLLAAVAAALVVALAAGAVAGVQRRSAERARARADEAAALAEQERGVAADAAREARIEALVGRADSLRATQRDTAALLAVEAYRLADTPRTRSSLFATFTDDERFLDAHRFAGARGNAGIVLPDGTSAYLTDGDGRLRPYDLDTGSIGSALPSIGSTPDPYPVLAASADSRLVAQAARADARTGPTTIAVHDLDDGTLRFAPVTIDGAVTAAAFLREPDRVAVTIGEAGDLLVLDAHDGRRLATIAGVPIPEDDIVWSLEPTTRTAGAALRRPSGIAVAGSSLLVGTSDGSLRVFDASTLTLGRTLDVAPDTLGTLRPLEDGTVVTSGRLGVARVDLATGAPTWQTLEQETCVNLAVAEDLGTFYCGDPYGRLSEHDLATGADVRRMDAQNGNSGSLWVARDGTELVSFGTFEPVVARWRLDGSGPVTRVMAPGWRPVAFNHDGDLLLTETGHPLDAEHEGEYAARVVDVASGDIVDRLDGLLVPAWASADVAVGALLDAAGDVVNAAYDLTDGTFTLHGEPFSLAEASTVVANDLDTGKAYMLLRYREGTDNWLARFDVTTFRPGPRIPVDGLVSHAISRDGDRIVAGTTSGVLVWDAETGEQVGSIPGTDLRSVFVTVTDQLFVGSLGGELVQYDLDSLREVRTFGGSRGQVFGGAGTADGSLVAIGGGDHRVVLYDTTTGEEIGTPITVPEGQQNQVRLSLDGRWLAVGGERGDDGGRYGHPFQLWDLDPETWIAAACRVAGRNLTHAEWEAHVGDLAPYRPTCPDVPLPA